MAVEGFTGNRQPVDAKVGELNPSSRAVNVLAKVVSKSEIRNITAGRDGEPHKVSDALVGDATGCIYLTLWDDNIEKVCLQKNLKEIHGSCEPGLEGLLDED